VERSILITLVPKKGDLQFIQNWRPISLANVGYKIMAKVYARRLMPLMEDIIGPAQSGFVPGRDIRDNVLEAVIVGQAATRDASVRGGMVLLDFEKAYDRLNRKFLFQTLAAIGFGPAFIAAVRLLHFDTIGRVMVNQHISDPFPINSGVKQGCPLAPLLFAIATEPLQSLFLRDALLVGLKVHGRRLLIRFYADDTVLFLADGPDADRAMALIALFGQASGLLLNFTKCAVVPLNVPYFPVFDPAGGPDAMRTLGPNDYEPLLGFKLNPFAKQDGLLAALEQKVVARMKKWSDRQVPLLTRVTILRSSIAPVLWYLWTFLHISDTHIMAMQQHFFRFVWQSPVARISYDQSYRPLHEGGISVPDLFAIRWATKAKIAFRVFSGACSDSLRHLFLAEAAAIWRRPGTFGGVEFPRTALHGPFPHNYRMLGLVPECLYFWSRFRPDKPLEILNSLPPVERFFFYPMCFSWPPHYISRVLELHPVTGLPLRCYAYRVEPGGLVHPVTTESVAGSPIGLSDFVPDGVRRALLTVARLSPKSESESLALVGHTFDALEFSGMKLYSPSAVLFAGNPEPVVHPIRPLLAIPFAKTTQATLTRLASSASLERSVYSKWEGSYDALGRLLRWFPKAPIGTDLRSFIPLWCHRTAVIWDWRVQPCRYCDAPTCGFSHFYFECQAVKVAYFVALQFHLWLGCSIRDLARPWCSPFSRKTQTFVEAECWNVSVWFARRAIYNVRTATYLDSGDAASLVSILTVWQRYLREFVSFALSSNELAKRFSCGGKWIRRDGPRYISSLTFTTMLGGEDD
jgi:hypothetical protein